MTTRWRSATLLAALAGTVWLGACELPDELEVDEAPPDEAVAETQQAVITADGCDVGDESLPSYARSCANAMGGIEVPEFNCNNGVAVPDTQGDGLPYPDETCDRPNVLNGKCDPGSKFQVLIDQKNANNQRVVMVAHCRRKEAPEGQFEDVAVIAYNYATGDTCFFQDKAPGVANEAKAPAPKDDAANDFWDTPANTSSCIHCHDNGPFIRSPYLTQLKGTPATEAGDPEHSDILLAQVAAAMKSPQAILPGSRDSGWNSTQPYRFVGKNFQGWKAYAVSLQKSALGLASNQCTQCHRMGISSVENASFAFNVGGGTSQSFGLQATGEGAFQQSQKNPHTGTLGALTTSPIWMLPSQKSYAQGTFDEAKLVQTCAKAIIAGGALPPGCGYVQFAQGNTCHGTGITGTVNGGTSSTPTTDPHVDVIDIPAGGKVAWGGWTKLHGPFVEKSTNIPYGSAGFDGTIAALTVEGNPAHFKISAGWQGPPANPPRPGAGGTVEFTHYSEIAGVPADPSCGYGGGTKLEDLPGTTFSLQKQVDTGLKFIDVPTTFIGNLSRVLDKDFFGIRENGAISNLKRQISKVGAFQGEAFAYQCAGWTPTFSVLHKGTSTDVELIAAPNAKKHRCILTGISGNWATTNSDGTVQPYAEIYSSGQSTRLRVVAATTAAADRIYAEASCIQIQP